MKKKFSLLMVVMTLVVTLLTLTACSTNNGYKDTNTNNNKQEETSIQHTIYLKAQSAGYEGTYEEWLNSIKGADGIDGKQIELSIENNKIVWRYIGDSKWTEIYSVNDLIGPKGDKGDQGAVGPQGETGLSAYQIYLKYHPEYKGTEEQWINDLVNGRLGAVEETDEVYFTSLPIKTIMPSIINQGVNLLDTNTQSNKFINALTQNQEIKTKLKDVNCIQITYTLEDSNVAVIQSETNVLQKVKLTYEIWGKKSDNKVNKFTINDDTLYDAEKVFTGVNSDIINANNNNKITITLDGFDGTSTGTGKVDRILIVDKNKATDNFDNLKIAVEEVNLTPYEKDKKYFEGLKLSETIKELATKGFDLLSADTKLQNYALQDKLLKDTNKKEILKSVSAIFFKIDKVNGKLKITYEISGKKYADKINDFVYLDNNVYEFKQLFKDNNESVIDFNAQKIVYAYNFFNDINGMAPSENMMGVDALDKNLTFLLYREIMVEKANVSIDMQELNIFNYIESFINETIALNHKINIGNTDIKNNEFALFIENNEEIKHVLPCMQKIIFSFEIANESQYTIKVTIIGQHNAKNPVEINSKLSCFVEPRPYDDGQIAVCRIGHYSQGYREAFV